MLIQISAGDLSEFCFPQGSLGVMPSVDRMFEGTRAHKKLQNLYKENEKIKYQREVPLEIIEEFDNFKLKVQGRADGIFFDSKDWFIHEIKSTYIKSLLFYLPYAVLSAMTIPAIFYSTGNLTTAIVGTVVAVIVAYFDKPLIVVALSAAASALVTGLII